MANSKTAYLTPHLRTRLDASLVVMGEPEAAKTT